MNSCSLDLIKWKKREIKERVERASMKVDTPIVNFLEQYRQSNMARFHMPGHKGNVFLGCEPLDITEVKGADSLYEADGIIKKSEERATKLFGTYRTLYSTEGSSQCIRAMLALAVMVSKTMSKKRPLILAARNVHKAFLYAAALVDVDVAWLYDETGDWQVDSSQEQGDDSVNWADDTTRGDMVQKKRGEKKEKGRNAKSLYKCDISPVQLEQTLKQLQRQGRKPVAVYVTSPNYLGQQLDIKNLARVAHSYGVLFLVDNAHGAYLHFLEKTEHPIDLGADLCCDSAHKTLPVLTGGAYLHIAKREDKENVTEQVPHMKDGVEQEREMKQIHNMPCYAKQFSKMAKQAMALFGSTSPSYLIMASLDACNGYLADGYTKKLKRKIKEIHTLRENLKKQGWTVEKTDSLKLTIQVPNQMGLWVSDALRQKGIECEYAEENYVVFMITVENTTEQLKLLQQSLEEVAEQMKIQTKIKQCEQQEQIKEITSGQEVRKNNLKQQKIREKTPKEQQKNSRQDNDLKVKNNEAPKEENKSNVQICTIREAIFAPSETISVKEALGRICATPTVTCPPAIPIAVAGEEITEAAIQLFLQYHIQEVDVVLTTKK